MEKEMKQESDWQEAQKIVIRVDLLSAAKQQLKFLEAVDKNRALYEGHLLERAIYRYNACWLPLLAKHSESPIFEGPLVVPLDCEWIWHCHRLNPVRYKTDCEEFYGRILDNSNVVSSVKGTCRRQTKETWNKLYPSEPYDLDLTTAFSTATNDGILTLEKCTKYDLVSAVKRQSPFFYQVSRPHIDNDVFLEEAVARYKGFLHLIKRNKEKSVKRFCVPTYDIDLIWHTHQLHPVSYCKDLSEAVGKVLEHDDTDSDRSKGKKLDTGFSGTTKQFEETFGRRYWKAGAMYRGNQPSPLKVIPFPSNILSKKVVQSSDYQKIIQLSEKKIMEVFVEIVGVKNLPEGHKGNLFVRCSKKQPDMFFNVKRKLTILSECREKQVASFQCEPTGDLFFELISHSPSSLPVTKLFKTLGTTTFSLHDFLNPLSKLSAEKWVELLPSSHNVSSNPICLRIAVSFTVPEQAPHEFQMIHSRPLSKSSCLFPLPLRIQRGSSSTCITDETDAEIISFQMRDSAKDQVTDKTILKKQVTGVMKSGETRTLAEFGGTRWSLMDSQWSLRLQKKSSDGGHLFELVGYKMVKIYRGRKLEYEPRHCQKKRSEQDFMTAIEFSRKDPYGKAVALLDLKYGLLEVKEEWLVFPGIISAFILSDILKKEGHDGFAVKEKHLIVENVVENDIEIPEETPYSEKNGVCGDSCKVGCGNTMETGGSGGAYGSVVKSSGCGSGCGGSCRSVVKSSGCGSGCSGACGSCGGGACRGTLESGGCGGCGVGASEDMIKSGGCGGCGAGASEDMIESGGCGGCGAGASEDMTKSGGCSGCGAGASEDMIKSGGCGGCGGSCSELTMNESSVNNSCTDNCTKESPIYLNEAVVT